LNHICATTCFDDAYYWNADLICTICNNATDYIDGSTGIGCLTGAGACTNYIITDDTNPYTRHYKVCADGITCSDKLSPVLTHSTNNDKWYPYQYQLTCETAPNNTAKALGVFWINSCIDYYQTLCDTNAG